MSAFIFLVVAFVLIFLQTSNAVPKIKVFLYIATGIVGFLFLYLNFNAPVSTFNNAEKHVLSAEAIEFDNALKLYQESDFIINKDTLSQEDNNIDHSINGLNYGGLEIQNDNEPKIILKNFAKPFYIKTNRGYELQNKIGNSLKNNAIIEFADNSSLNFKINATYPYYTVTLIDSSKLENFELDLITIKNIKQKKLDYGYPLSSFIIDNISVKELDDKQVSSYQALINKLESINGIYLLRSVKGNNESDYALAGRFDLDDIISFIIDNKELKSFQNNFQIELKDSTKISLSYHKLKPEDYSIKKTKNIVSKDVLRLEYDFIKWFPLYSDKTDNELRIFFTSNPMSVVKTVFNKGLFFDGNKNAQSETSFDASLSYKQGSSSSDFNLEILDHHLANIPSKVANQLIVKPNSEFKLHTKLNTFSNNDEIVRTFKLIDVESKSNFKPLILYVFYALVSLLLLFLISFEGSKHNDTHITFKRYFPPLASVIIVFVAFKFFLLWRSSVFLPFSDLNDSIYNNLNNSNYLYRNTIIPFFLFFIIALIRKFNLLNNSFKNKVKLNSIWNQKGIFICYVLLFGLLIWRIVKLHLQIPFSDRLTAIYFPLILFFISFYWILTSSLTNTIKNNFSLFNFLIFSLFFVVSDTGFAIIFILFFIITQITLLLNSSFNANGKKIPINKIVWFYVLMLLLIITGFTFFIATIFNHLTYFIISVAIIAIVVLVLLAFKYKLHTNNFLEAFLNTIPKMQSKVSNKLLNRIRITSFYMLVVSSIVIIVFGKSIGDKVSSDYVHIKYRAQTLTEEIKDIVENEEFGTYNARKIVETATNKWFLSYFLEKGNHVEILNFDKPFELQKHFKHGVTYTTQSTDVMVSRYLIGEHGWITPLLLALLILVVFVYLLMYTPKNYHDNKNNTKSLVSILGLAFLIVMALFVNLTVTNKFIFFGQDFPLLSIQSFLSSLSFFTVFAAIFYWFSHHEIKEKSITTPNVVPQKKGAWNPSLGLTNTFSSNNRNNFHPPKVKNFLFYIIIIILFFITPILLYKNNYQDTFKLGHVFSDISKDFDQLNNSLLLIQKDSLKRHNLSDLFESVKIDTVNSNKYSITLYDKFKDQIKLSKSKDFYKLNVSGKLGPLVIKRNNKNIVEVKIQNRFYDLPSPDAFEKQWKGSLVAKNINNSSTITNISDLDNIKTISHTSHTKLEPLDEEAINVEINVLPASWFYNEKHDIVAVDLRSGTQDGTTSKFNILRANENVKTSSLSTLATRLYNEDIISIDDVNFKKQYFYASENIKYFAKNIWLNGDFKHFYPFEDDFILGYNLVENLKSDSLLNKSQLNIELGLDFDIYHNIQELLEQNLVQAKNGVSRRYSKYNDVVKSMNANLIVATGDGDIIAINDAKFKEPSFYLNPNDDESIYRSRLKLLSSYNYQDEEKVFGNNNLLKLQTGPQSTIKPIMWTALTSGYRLSWENLSYTPPNNMSKFQDPIKTDLFKLLDGKLNLSSAEPTNPCDNKRYLIKSLNTFNTLVTIFGSYTEDDFKNLESKVFKSFDANNEEFPSFRYNGNRYTFNFDKFKYNNTYSFTEKNSIFGDRLSRNFNLSTEREDEDRLKLTPFNNGKSAYTWVNPSFSSLYMIDRKSTKLGVNQVVAGADPINASPIKMVEMYGKLFSGNKEFSLKLCDKVNEDKKSISKTNYSPFDINSNWEGYNNWYNFLGTQIFSSMNEATNSGTSSSLTKYPNYYFYGKTGTGSNENFRDANIANKHLVVVISKENLGQNLTEEKLKNNKFIVLYFSLHNVVDSQYFQYKNKMIKAVMESPYVNYYFNKK